MPNPISNIIEVLSLNEEHYDVLYRNVKTSWKNGISIDVIIRDNLALCGEVKEGFSLGFIVGRLVESNHLKLKLSIFEQELKKLL